MTYSTLLNQPPKLTIPNGSTEIIFNLVSCMCDNKNKIILKKNSEGLFTLPSTGHSLSNFQIKSRNPYQDITWNADEGNWEEVIRIINSGTSLISDIQARNTKKIELAPAPKEYKASEIVKRMKKKVDKDNGIMDISDVIHMLENLEQCDLGFTTKGLNKYIKENFSA